MLGGIDWHRAEIELNAAKAHVWFVRVKASEVVTGACHLWCQGPKNLATWYCLGVESLGKRKILDEDHMHCARVRSNLGLLIGGRRCFILCMVQDQECRNHLTPGR